MNTVQNNVYKVLSLAIFCLFFMMTTHAAKPARVEVCHTPPDEPDNLQIKKLKAGSKQLENHLSHGDWLVSEEMCDAIADNNCDGVAATQQEDDASCDDGLVTTLDSCQAGLCVNESEAQCPCDFAALLPLANPPWTATPRFEAFIADDYVNICRLIIPNDNLPRIDLIIDFEFSPTTYSCNVFQSATQRTVFETQDPDVHEACRSDLNAYLIALNDVAGIGVNANGDLHCPTF